MPSKKIHDNNPGSACLQSRPLSIKPAYMQVENQWIAVYARKEFHRNYFRTPDRLFFLFERSGAVLGTRAVCALIRHGYQANGPGTQSGFLSFARLTILRSGLWPVIFGSRRLAIEAVAPSQ